MVRGSNRLTSSSSTNTPPAMGALKAVASPAAAPPATRTRRSARLRRVRVATMTAAVPPIWTDGPSRPRAMPLPMANSPPMYLTGRIRNRSGRTRPSATASTRGIPLPSACGSIRCTRAAAIAAAAVHTSTTTNNPDQLPCAQPASPSRSRAPCCSRSRKLAALRPVSTPTKAAATTNPIRLSAPSPSSSTGRADGRCHPVSMLRRTSRQLSRSSSCTPIA